MPGFKIAIATLVALMSACGCQQIDNSSLLGIVHGTGEVHRSAVKALQTPVMITRNA